MHLVDLGVMKKLLKLWLNDPDFDKEEANKFLKEVKPYIPSDFTRKPRNLDEFENYKATELRLIVLYIGVPMLLRCCSSTEKVKNFLQLSMGYRLLMGRNGQVDETDCRYAQQLYQDFVNGFSELYGPEHVSFNIHGLLHLHQMVTLYGPLSTFTAYDFENYYQLVRKWVRRGGYYFEQIFRRWRQTGGKVLRKKSKGPKGSFILASNKKDSCVMLNDGTVWLLVEKKLTDAGMIFVGKKFLNKTLLFNDPSPTLQMNIFNVSNLTDEAQQINTEDIIVKFVCMPNNESFDIIPLIH